MPIHRQNLYAPHGKQHTSHREVQSCESVNSVKKLSVYEHLPGVAKLN